MSPIVNRTSWFNHWFCPSAVGMETWWGGGADIGNESPAGRFTRIENISLAVKQFPTFKEFIFFRVHTPACPSPFYSLCVLGNGCATTQ